MPLIDIKDGGQPSGKGVSELLERARPQIPFTKSANLGQPSINYTLLCLIN